MPSYTASSVLMFTGKFLISCFVSRWQFFFFFSWNQVMKYLPSWGSHIQPPFLLLWDKDIYELWTRLNELFSVHDLHRSQNNYTAELETLCPDKLPLTVIESQIPDVIFRPLIHWFPVIQVNLLFSFSFTSLWKKYNHRFAPSIALAIRSWCYWILTIINNLFVRKQKIRGSSSISNTFVWSLLYIFCQLESLLYKKRSLFFHPAVGPDQTRPHVRHDCGGVKIWIHLILLVWSHLGHGDVGLE